MCHRLPPNGNFDEWVWLIQHEGEPHPCNVCDYGAEGCCMHGQVREEATSSTNEEVNS